MYGNLIEAVTVATTGTGSITFSNIPQTYSDLIIVYTLDWTANIRFNGDSGTNYSYRDLHAVSSASSGSTTGATSGLTNRLWNGGEYMNSFVYIPNYSTAQYKTYSSDFITELNTSGVERGIVVGYWNSTAAITSITLMQGSYTAGTTAYLYGLNKGSGGATVS